jgi:hypothetical protein
MPAKTRSMTKKAEQRDDKLRKTERVRGEGETLRTMRVEYVRQETETRAVPATTLQPRRKGDGEDCVGQGRRRTVRRLYEKRRRYHAPYWPEGTVLKVPCRVELEGLAADIAARAAHTMNKIGHAATAHQYLPDVCNNMVLYHEEISLRRTVYQSADTVFFLGLGKVLTSMEEKAWDARATGAPCDVHFTFKYSRDEDGSDGIYHHFVLEYALTAKCL